MTHAAFSGQKRSFSQYSPSGESHIEEQKFPRLRSYHLVFTWVFRLVEINMLADYSPPLNGILDRMRLKRGKNHPKDAKTPNIWSFFGNFRV